jgi:hypothetical protein
MKCPFCRAEGVYAGPTVIGDAYNCTSCGLPDGTPSSWIGAYRKEVSLTVGAMRAHDEQTRAEDAA